MMTIEQKVQLIVRIGIGASPANDAERQAVGLLLTEFFTLSSALQSAERHLAAIVGQLERLAAETTR